MKTQITERDIKLLCFLGAVIIVVAGFMYLIRPAIDTRDELEIELDAARQERDAAMVRIAQLPLNKQLLEDLVVQYDELSAGFFDPMEAREADKLVTDVLLNHGLSIMSLSLSGGQTDEMIPFYASDVGQTASMRAFTVTFRAVGSEDALWQTVDEFANGDKAIRIASYSLTLYNKTEQTGAVLTDFVPGFEERGELTMTVCIYMAAE